jgi:hypothetical protein
MDTEDLLRFLNAHRVEFVIIGATAFPPNPQTEEIGKSSLSFLSPVEQEEPFGSLFQ